MNKPFLYKLQTTAQAMALLAVSCFTFSSCGGDDDDKDKTIISPETVTEQVISVPNGTYHSSAMPASTTSQPIGGISISNQGEGTATISISSGVEYDRFYVGIEGATGYIEYVPGSSRAGSFNYQIPVAFGIKAPGSMTLQVKGRTKDGDITSAYSQNVQTFGADIGTNNVEEVKGKWRYEYEQEDDMGTIREDYSFQSFGTSKVADFSMDEYETTYAWQVQVEGQYKLQGSTLRLYIRRARTKAFSDWSSWYEKGNPALLGPSINWQNYYNTWTDYVNQAEGDVWECIVNDAKTQMQWRKLKVVYKWDPVMNKETVSYVYDDSYPIRQLKKI